jgi:autotransporter passenger strand-loop-strand repeat protein
MTDYTIPPNNKEPIDLKSGDILTVNSGGKSTDVTIQDGATEDVNAGGTSFRTTINEGGIENVNHGTTDFTTINGGLETLDHSTATNTRLNFSLANPDSQIYALDGSVVKNTIIEGGSIPGHQIGLLVAETSTADNVTFINPGGKFNLGAGFGLDNPLNFKGFIKGLSVGDFIALGGLNSKDSLSIDVTGFKLTNNQHDVTITYNNNQQVTYHLQDMQANTTFEIQHGKDSFGHDQSQLIVVKTVGIADVHDDVAGHLLV